MTQEDLFSDIQPSLSPRLKWMQKHKLQTRLNPHLESREAPWEACQVDPGQDLNDALVEALGLGILATGETEEAALVEWAQLTGTPLWHEEAHQLESAWREIDQEEFIQAFEHIQERKEA
jgi:hypothetical protein